MHLRLAHAAFVAAVATSFTLAGCGGGSSEDGGPACTPVAELCNGVDDDCDSQVDEDFTALGTDCTAGVGACETTGVVVCDGAGTGVECSAAPGAPSTELCNGADDDCNPATADGSGEATLGEACDGADADLCAEGAMVCQLGAMVCTDATGNAVETCNTADDDCDGAVDDMPASFYAQACCATGNLADCTNTGGGTRCAAGAPVCETGMILCAGSVAKELETCNGVDDDCDGVVDDVAGIGDACSGDGSNTTGACTAIWSCDPGNLGSGPGGLRCTQLVGPGAELCDGVDTDCDGSLDGGAQPPVGFTCLSAGPCAGTTPSCAGADGWTCNYTSPYVERDANGDVVATELLCDGEDGNCSGTRDESFTDLGQPCDDGGVGACMGTGESVCSADHLSTACYLTTPGAAATDEVCDGLDNDCDGTTDDPFGPGGTVTLTELDGSTGRWKGQSCGLGACAGGTVVCAGDGLGLACSTWGNATSEVCFDGVDDDCDGLADTADPDCPATWSHTVTMDGLNDFTAAERFSTTSGGYQGWLTWDASNLYLGVQGPAVTSNSTTRWILVYLGAVGPGTTTGVMYGTVSPTLPFAATHHYRMRLDFGYMNILGFNGTSWSGLPWTTEFGGVQGDFAEMNIPLGTLGSPTTLRVHVSMINEATGGEWTWSGIPANSFIDSVDPDYAHYFEFNLTGSAAPASYVAQ